MEEEGTTLTQALQEWGTREDDVEIQTLDDHIKIWFEPAMIYDSYANAASYHALHDKIPTTTLLGFSNQDPMEEPRLEVLLHQLLQVFPNLWERTDWLVTSH